MLIRIYVVISIGNKYNIYKHIKYHIKSYNYFLLIYSHEHNVILPIDRLRSLLIRIATVKNDRNNYVNYYQKKEHILLL